MTMPYSLGFQEGGSKSIYNMIELYNDIVFYLIIIGVLIIWIMSVIIRQSRVIGDSYIHLKKGATIIEVIWTVSPALILIAIAIPSLKMLYMSNDEMYITLKVIGNQWYWRYEYNDTIGYDSFMIPTDDLEVGKLRLLEVDNPVVLPVLTPIKALITSADVIHSFSIPSLGIKTDAIPGRINGVEFKIIRSGEYYGQCSELCGSAHGMMPSMIKGVRIEEYVSWLESV